LKFELLLELNLNKLKGKRKNKQALLQWAWPTEALGLARLTGSAHLAFLTHGKNRGNFSPPAQQRRLSIPVVASDEVAEEGGG
jgi:hypothetical protein